MEEIYNYNLKISIKINNKIVGCTDDKTSAINTILFINVNDVITILLEDDICFNHRLPSSINNSLIVEFLCDI